MKAVNWGRGFFRVWMLLTVLWIVFALLVGWSGVANPYVSAKDVGIVAATDEPDLLEQYGQVHTAMEDGVRAGNTKKTSLKQYGFYLYTGASLEPWKYYEYVDKANARVADYVEAETVKKRSQAVPQLAMGVIVPPLIVLLLGWAIGWAISGFRRAPENIR